MKDIVDSFRTLVRIASELFNAFISIVEIIEDEFLKDRTVGFCVEIATDDPGVRGGIRPDGFLNQFLHLSIPDALIARDVLALPFQVCPGDFDDPEIALETGDKSKMAGTRDPQQSVGVIDRFTPNQPQHALSGKYGTAIRLALFFLCVVAGITFCAKAKLEEGVRVFLDLL